MIYWMDIFTIIVSVFLCIKYFKGIVKSSRYIVYFMFILFYVFPILLDYIVAFPLYKDWSTAGFRVAQYDELTRVIYDIAVLFIQFCILYFHKRKYRNIISADIDNQKNDGDNDLKLTSNNSDDKTAHFFLIAGMVLPVILVLLLSSDFFILYTLQWREIKDIIPARYTYFEKLSYIGVASSLILFNTSITTNKTILSKIIYCLFLYINICVEGKRSIIFFALLVYAIIKIPGLKNKDLSLKQRHIKLLGLSLICLFAMIVMVALTVYVKTGSRGYSTDFSQLYTAIRVDFLRDDRVRLAIYSMLYPDRLKILDFPMQTILSGCTTIFPIDYILTKKGIGFTTYSSFLTSAITGYKMQGIMSPSFFAELISNMGAIGIFVMSCICLFFSQKIDKFVYPYNILIVSSFVLLQMYDISYISYFLEFTIILCFIKSKQDKRLKRKLQYAKIRSR